MVEIFQTVGIDYRQGPEKGVGFQCFSELLSAYEATMVKNEQCGRVAVWKSRSVEESKCGRVAVWKSCSKGE